MPTKTFESPCLKTLISGHTASPALMKDDDDQPIENDIACS
jgi:hypothetical protein